MSRQDSWQEPEPMLAPALSAIGLALLLLFAIGVFSQMLPLRLLAPPWQLRMAALVIERAPLALIGLGLLQLAAHLDPTAPHLRARWQAIGRLGVIAVLGFLLLVPLQAVASAGSLRGLDSAQRAQQLQVERNLNRLRREIRAAGSLGDLQRRIRDIQAPDLLLDADSLSRPLPQLKQSLLASVDQSERQLNRRFSRGSGGRTWAVLERSGRGILSSLVLAFAFAACTPQWHDPELSLLMAWHRSVWMLRNRRRAKRHGTYSNEEYIQKMNEAEP